jgi:hypothetical protein
MASKKASARDRADQFLAAIGTAGGPIGAPGLVAFGASDVARQIQSGNIDQYAAIRMMNGGPVVGDPNAPQPRMPQDPDAAYLKLNLPGSPLPRNGLLAPQFQKAAENIQNQLINQEQYAMMSMMPLTGQLPMLIQPPMPQKKGGR